MNFVGLLLLLLGTWSAVPLRSAETIVVAFGDSMTAARPGLPVYAELLPPRLASAMGVTVKVINAGVPGDTTNYARRRFAADVLAKHPVLVINAVWRRP